MIQRRRRALALERRRKDRNIEPHTVIVRVIRWLLMLSVVAMIVAILMLSQEDSWNPLDRLPGIVSKLRDPVTIRVNKVVEMEAFNGLSPREAHKFIMIHTEIACRMKVAYPIVPECFQVVDSEGGRHFPLQDSPLFSERTAEFYLDTGDRFPARIVFEIPSGVDAKRLFFNRAKRAEGR